jgi:hypothetical protein
MLALTLAGCAGDRMASIGGSGGTTLSTPSPPVQPSLRIIYPSIFVTDYDTTPITVVVMSSAATTVTRIPGYHPEVDGAGNIYVVSCLLGYRSCTSASINVYSPDPFQIVRSLPVGPGTRIPNVDDFTVSAAGEIFVNDGNGIAVFSQTANGDVDPVRRIMGKFPAAAYYPVMTVDGAGNLYVPIAEGIAVFGPGDTGAAGPSRVINVHAGQLATDSQGNLYVLDYRKRDDGLNPFGVSEYASTVSGNAVPLRYITTPGMSTTGWNDIPGIAVDAAGTIYVSATFGDGLNQWGGPGVWEFAADASGSVAPLTTLTWSGENNGGIAVH